MNSNSATETMKNHSTMRHTKTKQNYQNRMETKEGI